jgi:hypothetical protein
MASLQASLRAEASRAPENLAAIIGNVNRLMYEAASHSHAEPRDGIIARGCWNTK